MKIKEVVSKSPAPVCHYCFGPYRPAEYRLVPRKSAYLKVLLYQMINVVLENEKFDRYIEELVTDLDGKELCKVHYSFIQKTGILKEVAGFNPIIAHVKYKKARRKNVSN